MQILVTGASGLLGINLALEAAQSTEGMLRRARVFGLVNRQFVNLQPENSRPKSSGPDFSGTFHLEGRLQFLQADLTAPGAIERVLDQTQPDWVIHCAALALVDECEADPERAQKLNSEVPGKLAEHVARGGARLVHISTDAVFDGKRGNYTETDTPNPLSVYARTKLAGEQAVAAANPNAIIARVNLFGWSISGKRSLSEFFFYNLQAGKPIKGFTDVYFCPLLANDLAHILLQMLAKDLHGLYHVVSRECISKYEFGKRIARRFGFDEGLITPGEMAQGDLKATRSLNLGLNTQKLTATLGYPPPGVDEGIERYYRLFQKGYPQMLQKSKSSAGGA